MANVLGLLNPFDVVKGYEYANDQNQQDKKFQAAMDADGRKAQQDSLKLQLAQEQFDTYKADAPMRAAQQSLAQQSLALQATNSPLQEQQINQTIATYQQTNPGASTIEALERASTNSTDPLTITALKRRLNTEYLSASKQAAASNNLALAEQYRRKAGQIDLGFVPNQAPLNPNVLVDDNGQPNVITLPGLSNPDGTPVTGRAYNEMLTGRSPSYMVNAEAAAAAQARATASNTSAEERTAATNEARIFIEKLKIAHAETKGAKPALDAIGEKVALVDKLIADNQTQLVAAKNAGLTDQAARLDAESTKLWTSKNDLWKEAAALDESLKRQAALQIQTARGAAVDQAVQQAGPLIPPVTEPNIATRPAPQPLKITPAAPVVPATPAPGTKAPGAPLAITPAILAQVAAIPNLSLPSALRKAQGRIAAQAEQNIPKGRGPSRPGIDTEIKRLTDGDPEYQAIRARLKAINPSLAL